tara:strand:- start:298 stop:555 length:258 start_codon:yes stop_codon:yes gene_type:complete
MKKEKKPFNEIEDLLHEICIIEIGEEYRIFQQSDDGGNHVVVAFEKSVPSNAKQYLPGIFMGWRLIIMVVPEGYLKVFHPLNKKQ